MQDSNVSIYIVTYRNPIDLNRNMHSLLSSNVSARINVINNHSDFYLSPEYESSVTVLHNRLRPDFSTGHLARNWNQALLLGFQDLNNPLSDVVVTVQDDVQFKVDWYHRLMELHKRFSFITMGPGDSFCSYLPEAVRKVGLWDERFCNIGFHEADYFLRSLIYNRDGCSINDPCHEREHNAVEGNTLHWPPGPDCSERAESLLVTTPHWNPDRKEAHMSSLRFHPLSETVFKHKWGVSAHKWTDAHYQVRGSLVPNYILYPYFEKEVESLREKNYVVAEEEHERHWAELAATAFE
jgi:hypothetical protein